MSIPALSGKNNRQADKVDIENVFWYAQGRYQRTGRCTLKKRISLICLLAAVLAAVVFCALWQSAAQDRSALRALAQSGAAEAYALFSDFQEKGYDSDYWGGVAAFHAFQQAYTILTDGTDKAANRPLCSAVFGGLLITPERAREHLPEILDAMRLLAADVTDENAFVHLAELSSALEE